LLDSSVYALNYVAMIAGSVYVHYYLVLPLYLRGKKILYFLLTFLVMTFFIIVYYCIDYFLPFDYFFDVEDLTWDYFLYDYLLIGLILAVTSLYYFVEQWFQNIQKESLLKTEKLQAELNFLKLQINPHFLFNTLNNIYAFAQIGNPKTAPMLERLSSILRFMVYDCSAENVALSKELNAVDDLLEIYRMKNSEQRNVQMTTEGVKGFHLIAPLIIVNLVENAFKHSDAISNPNGFIGIKIKVDEQDQCLCEISNSIKKKVNANAPYQGIGLENVKKRLDLQYDNSYSIDATRANNQYHLKLKIPLGVKYKI
ncbi:MAG: histidine kinase, partial [Bacteroidota bacterium]